MVLFTSIIFKKLLSFFLIIQTTFPVDAGSRVDNVRHTSRYFYPHANEVAKGYSNATVRPSVRPSHPCEYSRINILQWILTNLGTYLVLKRIWNPIYFQGQRSRSQGQNFTA
jgi:hypothetical protein